MLSHDHQKNPSPKLDEPLITSNLRTINCQALPLHFRASLNYLAVIGGATNSKHRGFFNEFEFQNNALNHLWWLISFAHSSGYTEALVDQDMIDLQQVFSKLLKCHYIDQLFNTETDDREVASSNAQTLFEELESTDHLLLHANDDGHAFYIEVNKKEGLYYVSVYNTGKGLFFHGSMRIARASEENAKSKLKYETKRTFGPMRLTPERLRRLTSNMSRLPFRILPRISIYKIYLLLSEWSLDSRNFLNQISLLLSRDSVSDEVRQTERAVLQARQKYGDCQNKSIMALIKNSVRPEVFLIYKFTLLTRTMVCVNKPPESDFKSPIQTLLSWQRQRQFQVGFQRTQAKAERTEIKLLETLQSNVNPVPKVCPSTCQSPGAFIKA